MSTTSDAVAVEVPDIGDFDEVPIIEILVSPGDTVAVDDPLLTLESDKATMDVPAPFAGDGSRADGRRRRQGVPGRQAAHARGRRGRGRRRVDREQGGRGGLGGRPSEGAAPEAIGSAAEAESGPRRPSPAGRVHAVLGRAVRRHAGRSSAGPRRAATGGSPRWRRRRRPRLRQPGRAPDRPRARRRPAPGERQRPQGPDHQGGRPVVRRARPEAATSAPSGAGAAAGGSGLGLDLAAVADRSTSRSSARSSGCSARGSSGSPARCWPATG